MEEDVMTKDPVCGMAVDEKTAPAREDYEGATYYFCSPACHASFKNDPKRYADDGDG
jgi:Cu+-exporting ATPase